MASRQAGGDIRNAEIRGQKSEGCPEEVTSRRRRSTSPSNSACSAAWTDASLFLFGLALILEALALWVISSRMGGKKIVLAISLFVVVIATVFNLYTAARVMGDNAIPLMSGIAAAMGGYMAIYQWKLLRVLNTGRAAPMT